MDASGRLPPINGAQQQTGYSQGQEQPIVYEGDNKKSIRQAGKVEINKAVMEAKQFIIEGQIEAANSLVYKRMND